MSTSLAMQLLTSDPMGLDEECVKPPSTQPQPRHDNKERSYFGLTCGHKAYKLTWDVLSSNA